MCEEGERKEEKESGRRSKPRRSEDNVCGEAGTHMLSIITRSTCEASSDALCDVNMTSSCNKRAESNE